MKPLVKITRTPLVIIEAVKEALRATIPEGNQHPFMLDWLDIEEGDNPITSKEGNIVSGIALSGKLRYFFVGVVRLEEIDVSGANDVPPNERIVARSVVFSSLILQNAPEWKPFLPSSQSPED